MEWLDGKFIDFIDNYDIYVVENEKKEKAAVKKINNNLLEYKSVIKILQKIEHPNVIDFFGYFDNLSRIFMVMEYIEGKDLFEVLNNNPFSEDMALQFLKEIKKGLDYLHSNNIIHRDVKLENVMVRGGDRNKADIVIIDFEYAIETTEKIIGICGTLDYLAPEMVLGDPYNYTVDLWSLGVLGFELINLKPPFYSSTEIEVKRKIVNKVFEFPPNFPFEYGKIINRLLSLNTKNRVFDI